MILLFDWLTWIVTSPQFYQKYLRIDWFEPGNDTTPSLQTHANPHEV